MKTMMYPEVSFEETFNGEPITGLQEFNGKLLVFTRNHVYVARKPRWYLAFWHRLVGLWNRMNSAL
jgi:hypothetical protein